MVGQSLELGQSVMPQGVDGLDFLENLGYRLQYNPKPSDWVLDREKDRKYTNAMDSLGLSVGDDGKITSIVPGRPGDKAALATNMTVTVTGWDINPRALGIVPKNYKVVAFDNMTWVNDTQYLMVPKGLSRGRASSSAV